MLISCARVFRYMNQDVIVLKKANRESGIFFGNNSFVMTSTRVLDKRLFAISIYCTIFGLNNGSLPYNRKQ